MVESGERTAMMSSVTAVNPCIIQFTVKTPKAKKDFMVPDNITVKLFKEVLSKHFNCHSSQLVLVFFGRILKDQDTLRQLGVRNGATVHLVIRKPRRCHEEEPVPSRSPPVSPCASPVPLDASRTSSTSAMPLRSSPSGSDASAWSAEQPSSEAMVQALENVFAESLLSNPDLMRQLIMANPQMQQLAQQIPEIGHILNNSHVMKEMLDMVKNSDMLREMRSQERAASNHEHAPGGDSALKRMENQDATAAAAREQFGNGSFAALLRNRCLERTCRKTQLSNEVREPLGSSPSPSATSMGSSNANLDTQGITSRQVGMGTALPTLAPELAGAGGVQNMLHQVTESLQLIVNLCAFYTKWMTLLLLQRSQLEAEAARQQQQQQQQQDAAPEGLQRAQNPDMLAAMANPKAMQACLQIEQGLQVLALEAPVLIPWFSFRLRSLGNAGGAASAANGSAGESPPRYEQSNDDV